MSAPPQNPPADTSHLFHFAECTVCRHILPLATTTDKYFAILAKNPRTPTAIGEKCMKCGADSWVLARD